MDLKQKNSELLKIIQDQKKELEKYKLKLRDIVTAHKGLIKEKAALEETVKVLNAPKTDCANVPISDENQTEDAKQLAALVSSLAAVTEEKTRVEQLFQDDIKRLREGQETADHRIVQLEEQLKAKESEIEELKSLLVVEKHERDKERSDHGAVMKELQNLLASERAMRMNMEQTLRESSRKSSETDLAKLEKAEKRMDRLKNELEVTKRKLELAERATKEPPRELIKLQDQLKNLQLEHQIAMQNERERAREVDERAKKQAFLQEERIVNLEAKLAELSQTVGAYDRLRMNDQTEIQKLKDHLATASHEKGKILSDPPAESFEDKKPQIVVSKENLHEKCEEELTRVKEEFRRFRKQLKSFQPKDESVKHDDYEERIKILRDRVRSLSDELQRHQQAHQVETDQLKQLHRMEKAKFKETLAAAEVDTRSRIHILETQLQKLRERTLALLEEKDQEIHSLQTTFQAFLPASTSSVTKELPALPEMRDGPRMLHYANELARRDVEIGQLRRAKGKLEMTLRDVQKTAIEEAERRREERVALREEIARLNRCQTREGANLEYLKNVVLSFLLSNDPDSKRHMCNAIAAVLKFSESELEKINKQQHNSWWSRASLT